MYELPILVDDHFISFLVIEIKLYLTIAFVWVLFFSPSPSPEHSIVDNKTEILNLTYMYIYQNIFVCCYFVKQWQLQQRLQLCWTCDHEALRDWYSVVRSPWGKHAIKSSILA